MKHNKAGVSRFRIADNIRFEVRDKNGNIKPQFQESFFLKLLLKFGIISPKSNKLPSEPRDTKWYHFFLGSWNSYKMVSNLITNAGAAGAASRFNGAGSEAAFTYVAVGTGATAANVADTTLQTELATSGLSRAAATCTRVTTDVTNDTAQESVTFTVTGTAAVTESGVFNAASSGVLASRQVFSAINVVNGDSLTITWKHDFD